MAFPVRVKVKVPEEGFGVLLAHINAWLRLAVGRWHYATGPAKATVMDAKAFYFRNTATADRFITTFELELADGTTGPT